MCHLAHILHQVVVVGWFRGGCVSNKVLGHRVSSVWDSESQRFLELIPRRGPLSRGGGSIRTCLRQDMGVQALQGGMILIVWSGVETQHLLDNTVFVLFLRSHLGIRHKIKQAVSRVSVKLTDQQLLMHPSLWPNGTEKRKPKQAAPVVDTMHRCERSS